MPKFVFDLDGTITKEETLPIIAGAFGIKEEMEKLTESAIKGNVPYVESFIKRVHILGKLPVDRVEAAIANISLYPDIVKFIERHNEDCIVATSNLIQWVKGIVNRLNCKHFCSEAIVADNKIVKIKRILKKEEIVELLQQDGEKVIFIGDGNNDHEAMRICDIGIAVGYTHAPSPALLTIADYAIYNEAALCNFLERLS